MTLAGLKKLIQSLTKDEIEKIKIGNDNYIKDYLGEYYHNIFERLKGVHAIKPEFSIAELNNAINSYYQANKNKFDELGVQNIDIIKPTLHKLDPSSEIYYTRYDHHRSAINILASILSEKQYQMSFNDIKKAQNSEDPDKDELYDNELSINSFLANDGNNLDSLSNMSKEKKVAYLENLLIQMNTVLDFLSLNTNDKEFINICAEYPNILACMNNLNGMMTDYIDKLGLEIADFKNQDLIKKWCTPETQKRASIISNDAIQRLSTMANPYYPMLSDIDISKLSAFYHNFEDFHNHLEGKYGKNIPTTDSELNEYDEISPIANLMKSTSTMYTSATYQMNNAHGKENDLELQTKTLKESYLQSMSHHAEGGTIESFIIKDGKSKKRDIFLDKGVVVGETDFYDPNTKEKIKEKEAWEQIAQGKTLFVLYRSNEDADKSIPMFGQIKKAENGRNTVHISFSGIEAGKEEKDIFPMAPYKTIELENNVKGLRKSVQNAIKKLKSLNRFVSNPTKEFTDLTTHLKELDKLNPGSKAYEEKIKDVVKDARDYLENKKFSSKKKTDKTYARMKFAKSILESFEFAIQAKEFKKVMQLEQYTGIKFEKNEKQNPELENIPNPTNYIKNIQEDYTSAKKEYIKYEEKSIAVQLGGSEKDIVKGGVNKQAFKDDSDSNDKQNDNTKKYVYRTIDKHNTNSIEKSEKARLEKLTPMLEAYSKLRNLHEGHTPEDETYSTELEVLKQMENDFHFFDITLDYLTKYASINDKNKFFEEKSPEEKKEEQERIDSISEQFDTSVDQYLVDDTLDIPDIDVDKEDFLEEIQTVDGKKKKYLEEKLEFKYDKIDSEFEEGLMKEKDFFEYSKSELGEFEVIKLETDLCKTNKSEFNGFDKFESIELEKELHDEILEDLNKANPNKIKTHYEKPSLSTNKSKDEPDL